MKIFCYLIAGAWLAVPQLSAQTIFTNFIRQVQAPSGVVWDASVAAAGQQLSALAIDQNGARFELWTVRASPLTSYLLDSRYVGSYVPVATVAIRSEDPYTLIPRTRADRPFYVDVSVGGLLSGVADPVASKSVKLLHHVQSYGANGTGMDIDRMQAIFLNQVMVTTNGKQTLTYAVNAVPADNRAKVRGEERFSVFSLEDYQAYESQLASQFIQIWPVADGKIEGILPGQVLRFDVPQLTLTYNDMYPSSTTYAQVYKGEAQLGKIGTVLSDSTKTITDSVPQSRVLTVSGYAEVFDSNGRWTMEILTRTPFGIDRLAHVSFDVDRTISVTGSFTTIE